MSTSKHFISLEKAKQMTKSFRHSKRKVIREDFHGKAILPICETFERSAFDALLQQPGCTAVRIYFGMDENLQVNLVIVGVNENDEDMLPAGSDSSMRAAATETSSTEGDPSAEQSYILDSATRCPTACPPVSPLNDDFS